MMGIPDDRFTFGWMGRTTCRQAHRDIVQAMKRLLDRNVDACLCLAGDGPDREPTEQLERTTSGPSSAACSSATRTTLRPTTRLLDALILPSANEALVSAIEASVAGRPVVATRVGGGATPGRSATEETASSSIRAMWTRSPIASAGLPPTASLRSGWGKQAAPVSRALPVSRPVGDVDDLYRRLLVEKAQVDRAIAVNDRDGRARGPRQTRRA